MQADSFWALQGVREISSQSDFYQQLSSSKEINCAIYRPDFLGQQVLGRTEKIMEVTFKSVSFSKTTLEGISFTRCKFINCLFIGATIRQCEFHSCSFINSNTHKISIENSYLPPDAFYKCLNKKKHQNLGVHLYQELMKNCSHQDQFEHEREAQFLFGRWKRYQDLYEFKKEWREASNLSRKWSAGAKLLSVMRRWSFEKFFGSGIKFRYYLITLLSSVLILTVINYNFREQFCLMDDGKLIDSIYDSFYFTVISLTTLGYGDITPESTSGRLAASFQSILGFGLFALFASMLYRKVSA